MCAGVAVAGSCGNDEFLCPEGWCAPLTLRCDGVRDCAGGEDEKLCGECARMRTRACHCYASTLAVRMGKAGADSDCLSRELYIRICIRFFIIWCVRTCLRDGISHGISRLSRSCREMPLVTLNCLIRSRLCDI